MSVASPTSSMPLTPSSRPEPTRLDLGRPFVHTVFDYALIGGGLSALVLFCLKLGVSPGLARVLRQNVWTFVLLSNSAHFAGSTVRLYTKQGTFRDLPFLTMGLPLVALVVLGLALASPAGIGSHLQSLYLTWSPYHYAAQAYGLSVMYCYRSGTDLSDRDRIWLRWTCFMPFLQAFLLGDGSGIGWIAPATRRVPWIAQSVAATASVAGWAAILLPLGFFVRRQFGGSRFPVISLLVLLVNVVWLYPRGLGDQLNLTVSAIGHGLQYLAILVIFHVKEQTRVPGDAPWWRHALRFYATCLALGYALFQLWPRAFVALGFGFAESMILVTAAINIHHFIVDGFIWRLRQDRNYTVLTTGVAPAPAPAPA